jgi:uncharacterized membrane protein YgcG
MEKFNFKYFYAILSLFLILIVILYNSKVYASLLQNNVLGTTEPFGISAVSHSTTSASHPSSTSSGGSSGGGGSRGGGGNGGTCVIS